MWRRRTADKQHSNLHIHTEKERGLKTATHQGVPQGEKEIRAGQPARSRSRSNPTGRAAMVKSSGGETWDAFLGRVVEAHVPSDLSQ